MATAEELLATVGNEQDYIVIDSDLRTMTFPASVKNIGVENDKDVHKLNFMMPRYFGEYDLSTFGIRINYLNANGDGDMYVVTDSTVEEDAIYFTWLVGRHACLYRGAVTFIVCLKLADNEGDVAQEYNTTLASLQVLPGLETEPTILETEHDVIEQLLLTVQDTNSKIKAVLDSGMTAKELGNIAKEQKTLKSRMDEFASLPDGSTAGDAELTDIRVGPDGTQYKTAGEAVRTQIADLKSALKYSELKSGYLSTAISVSAGSAHSYLDDKMDCDLKQGTRYFFSILNSEGVVATEMRAFYSDDTNEVIHRTESDNVVFEQLFPKKDIIAIGMYVLNGGQDVSVTRISVWDTMQIPQDYYQNEHAYIKSNGYVIRKDADNGASEITISDSIIVVCGTQIIEKSKADMLSEITGSVESGNGVKFTLDSDNALVYNFESNVLTIRHIPAVRPSEITLLFAHQNGITTGLLINKYLKKLIDDDHTTVTGLDTRISKVEDIIAGDINKTVVATIPAGAQSGVWVSLSGNARAVRVSCESDAINGYRIWTDAIAGSYIDAEVNKIYYVDILRNDNYQIQIPLVDMKPEGGTATFTWAYQSDILPPANSVEGRNLVDKIITISKLSNEAVETLWESGFSAPLDETYVDTEVSSVQGRLDSIQTENTSSIGFITDLHYYAYGDADDSRTRPFMRIARSLRLIDAKNMIDFIVLGGDYLWNNQDTTRARAEYAYKALQRSVLPLREKVFALKGNHDDNSLAYQGGQPVTAVVLPAEEYRYLGKQYEKCGTVYNPGDHNIYGYYDIPSQKIRCIFVNTGDLPYNISGDTLDYGAQYIAVIRQEQSEFIQEALRFNEAGWSVLFFSHHGLINCDVTGANSENYCADLWEIIKAYKNRATYTGTVTNEVSSYSVNVDYSDNLSNEIIACICGHVHADKSDVVDDILIVSTTCACPYLINHQIETADETSYDIFTVDRSNGKLYATRYGLGSDREWTYQS